MGTGPPKSAELFEELEDEVKDAIVTGITEDRVLDQILLIVINAIQTGRQLYSNPLEEPAFYQKYLRRWVDEGLEELMKVKRLEEKQTSKVTGENG